jgi:putative hydrolase of HD superfamily
MNAEQTTDAMIRLGRLALDFGKVERITYHPDGKSPESDTDHTVMLGLVACAIADQHFPHLNVGLIAQYALVHDLVEVYAGDTPTLHIPTADAKATKQAREHAAYEQIQREFADTLPWLPSLIGSYESLATDEARFVKVLDKFLPKVTHLLNGAATIREQGMSPEQLRHRLAVQRADLNGYATAFPQIWEIWDVLVSDFLAQVAGQERGDVGEDS